MSDLQDAPSVEHRASKTPIPVRWSQQCSKCYGWFTGESMTRVQMESVTYDGAVITFRRWHKEREVCGACLKGKKRLEI